MTHLDHSMIPTEMRGLRLLGAGALLFGVMAAPLSFLLAEIATSPAVAPQAGGARAIGLHGAAAVSASGAALLVWLLARWALRGVGRAVSMPSVGRGTLFAVGLGILAAIAGAGGGADLVQAIARGSYIAGGFLVCSALLWSRAPDLKWRLLQGLADTVWLMASWLAGAWVSVWLRAAFA